MLLASAAYQLRRLIPHRLAQPQSGPECRTVRPATLKKKKVGANEYAYCNYFPLCLSGQEGVSAELSRVIKPTASALLATPLPIPAVRADATASTLLAAPPLPAVRADATAPTLLAMMKTMTS